MRAAAGLMLLSLIFGVACSNDANESTAAVNTGSQPVAQASSQLTPEQLGELGAQMQKNPDRADELLTQHGLTKESFETAIRNITENPDASRRYAAAYKKTTA